MASATLVTDGDPSFAWVEIEDSDGKRWKYDRRGQAPHAAIVHLRIHVGPSAEFPTDANGATLLSQAGAGLPQTIIVSIEQVTPQPVVFPGILASWGGWHTYEYHQRP
jgi:hypothetical protein